MQALSAVVAPSSVSDARHEMGEYMKTNPNLLCIGICHYCGSTSGLPQAKHLEELWRLRTQRENDVVLTMVWSAGDESSTGFAMWQIAPRSVAELRARAGRVMEAIDNPCDYLVAVDPQFSSTQIVCLLYLSSLPLEGQANPVAGNRPLFVDRAPLLPLEPQVASLTSARADQLLQHLRKMVHEKNLVNGKLQEDHWYPDAECFATPSTAGGIRKAHLLSLSELQKSNDLTFTNKKKDGIVIQMVSKRGSH